MIWVLFGILTAFFFAAQNLAAKKLTNAIESKYLAFISVIGICIINLPFLIIFRENIILNQNAMIGLVLIGILGAGAEFFYMQALRFGGLSKTVPLLALSPLITVPFAFFLLGELPSSAGFIGIIVAISGAYILNLRHFSKKDVLRPFKELIKNKGSRNMLYVVLIFGFGAGIDKFIIVNANVWTRVLVARYFILVFLSLPFFCMFGKDFFKKAIRIAKKHRWFILVFLGLWYGVIVFQMIGFSLTVTAYVASIKRMAALFAVIGGYLFFKEKKDIKNALTGTLLMIGGVLLLTL